LIPAHQNLAAELNPASGEFTGGLAQGIRCGPLALAFPYGWSRAVVDEFALAPIPRAPHWLVGAASVDGTVTPVVDMQRLIGGKAMEFQAERGAKTRLLVGGIADAEANKTLALSFQGLPIQIERSERASGVGSDLYAPIAQALLGNTSKVGDTTFHFVDPIALYELIITRLTRH
jgi:CheW-like domain